MRSICLIGTICSFIASAVLHFKIDYNIGLRDSPLVPPAFRLHVAKEIEFLEVFRMGSFALGIVLLIITIILISKSKNQTQEVEAGDSELLDVEI